MKKKLILDFSDTTSRWNVDTIIKGLESLERERAYGSASVVDPLAEALQQAIRALRELKFIYNGGKKDKIRAIVAGQQMVQRPGPIGVNAVADEEIHVADAVEVTYTGGILHVRRARG